MSAVQLGRAFGARVIATVGSPEKLEFARRQGAEHVLDYQDNQWVRRPEEQNRFTTVAAVETGSPPRIATQRAMFALCGPCGHGTPDDHIFDFGGIELRRLP
jgi:D-arabinose 1-dehydrogenase-like Zn-dependent alcohol dehydrogenase